MPPVVSIVILCCNQSAVTRWCLRSLAQHTPEAHQLLLVDNGSTDDTPQLLQDFAREGHAGLVELSILRHETNLGFAAGVNQALARIQGDYVVLLNNDTILTPGWLSGLLAVAQNVPQAGLVGPVSNEVPEPQRVAPTYANDLRALDAFAQARRFSHARQVMDVERISGFCLLFSKQLLATIGLLDERFGLGFFEDDDLGVRVRRAGYKLVVALDTYIHHWGSQTVRALGLDTTQLLNSNLEKFREKWGSELANRYHLPPDPPQPISSPATVSLCMIVKNEEANLPDCLRGMQELFDDIVVVDTGSSDQTSAMAQTFGAKVVEFPWVDSFAAARNVAIENANSDFIFWLDADDRVDEINRAKLKQLFATLRPGDIVGTSMKCVCLPDPATGVTTEVDHIRLFPRHPEIRWKYRIHEQILPAIRRQDGTVRFADIQIHHVGYQDPALRRRKLDRDLRLLNLENDEHPDDPFTLFNLGSVFLELEDLPGAIPYLERSLARSHPTDSIVRKLYALLVQAHKRSGNLQAAIACCEQGQQLYPHDAELMFQEGSLRRERGDLSGAAVALERLLQTKEEAHFASVDAGLRGFRARHNLAVVYRDMGRPNDAIELWQQVIREVPDFVPARLGLVETCATNGHEYLTELAALQNNPSTRLDGFLLEGRVLLGQKQYAQAKACLELAQQEYPHSLQPKVLLSHVYLQEGNDWKTSRQLLEDILEVDPDNQEAKHNLSILLANSQNSQEHQ